MPPVMVAVLLTILYFTREGIFRGPADFWWNCFFLAALPVFAYPLAALLPALRTRGREGQRSMAFIMSLIAYPGALIYGLLAGAAEPLLLIEWTYLLSALILALLNKATPLRASGHACALAGPLYLLIYFLGWAVLLPCLALGALVCWSSLSLRRHTPRELFYGALTAALAFGLSRLIVYLL